MKKLITCLFMLFSFSLATIKIQGQASTLGYGYGLGLGKKIIPMVMEIGIEGAVYNTPEISSKGSYEGVPFEGAFQANSTRAGLYIKLNAPGLSMTPIIGPLFNPVLHFGTQRIALTVDGSVRPLDNGIPIEDDIAGNGSYFMVGFPAYFGPLYIEPAIGAQHIFVEDFGNFKNTLEAQIALGFSF